MASVMALTVSPDCYKCEEPAIMVSISQGTGYVSSHSIAVLFPLLFKE
ncbi:hypothetical protein ECAE60S_03940 [Eoetvoesiella caeni]